MTRAGPPEKQRRTRGCLTWPVREEVRMVLQAPPKKTDRQSTHQGEMGKMYGDGEFQSGSGHESPERRASSGERRGKEGGHRLVETTQNNLAKMIPL